MSTKEFGTDKKLEIDNIFLGIGSNQGDRELNLKESIKLLNSRVGKILNSSRIYESEPWGVKEQKNFLNQVIEIETHINPCLLYTSPSPRDRQKSRMPSSA